MIPGFQWNTKYFLLTQDDLMQEGDEFYNPVFDSWVQIDSPEGEGAYLDPMIGYPWDAEEHKPVRRKNPGYNPGAKLLGQRIFSMIAEPLPKQSEASIDLQTVYFIQVDQINGFWNRVPIPALQKGLDLGRNVLLVDFNSRNQELLPVFMLKELIPDVPDPDYMMVSIKADSENFTWKLDEYTTQIINRFHWSWINELADVLWTDWFKRILATVMQERKIQPVYPASQDIFTCFLTSYDSVRLGLVGMSTYSSNQANGKAFATDQKVKPPSLQILQEAIRTDLNLGITFELENNLVSLTKQGVFLYNVALTTTVDPSSHLALWAPFTKAVVAALNKKPDLTWYLLGKPAKELSGLINPKHTVLTDHHPSYYARSKAPMVTKNFSRIQESLNIKF